MKHLVYYVHISLSLNTSLCCPENMTFNNQDRKNSQNRVINLQLKNISSPYLLQSDGEQLPHRSLIHSSVPGHHPLHGMDLNEANSIEHLPLCSESCPACSRVLPLLAHKSIIHSSVPGPHTWDHTRQLFRFLLLPHKVAVVVYSGSNSLREWLLTGAKALACRNPFLSHLIKHNLYTMSFKLLQRPDGMSVASKTLHLQGSVNWETALAKQHGHHLLYKINHVQPVHEGDVCICFPENCNMLQSTKFLQVH